MPTKMLQTSDLFSLINKVTSWSTWCIPSQYFFPSFFLICPYFLLKCFSAHHWKNDHTLSLLVLTILFLVQMFSASARKARVRNNLFTLRMTIWGFPAVKLHAAVLVTSIEPVAFCHPFCPACNVWVLPALPKYCIHGTIGSVVHGFSELQPETLYTFCSHGFNSPSFPYCWSSFCPHRLSSTQDPIPACKIPTAFPKLIHTTTVFAMMLFLISASGHFLESQFFFQTYKLNTSK